MRQRLSRIPSILAAGVVLHGCVVATSTNSDDGGGGVGFFFLLIPVLFLVLIARSLRSGRPRRRRSSRQDREAQVARTAGDQRMIRAELSVLADDVLRLESQIALHDAARNDYESAVHRYRVAQAALDRSGGEAEVDPARLQRVVDEAMWSMARAKAVIGGYPPPAPPPQLQNPGPSGEPAVRLTDDDRPMYVDTPVSFRSGWFGGGLLGGLMMGPLLGGFGGWIVDDSSEGGGDPTDGGEGGEEFPDGDGF